jgi:hypothetical protein
MRSPCQQARKPGTGTITWGRRKTMGGWRAKSPGSKREPARYLGTFDTYAQAEAAIAAHLRKKASGE